MERIIGFRDFREDITRMISYRHDLKVNQLVVGLVSVR